ncbi:hypothetical protein BCR35DRAFT_305999 [Leucosporidium creatinivorum]|uniref:non-specific serine/threonine protein kinase n=1 Tax=Leucosporidium creatinivorum TaxID=106004 RepID=A0A1Y2EWK9_9BASI|nr:hypothetical protein BCR35DRAFT_305999 [Leucosporidium creatinivorum]
MAPTRPVQWTKLCWLLLFTVLSFQPPPAAVQPNNLAPTPPNRPAGSAAGAGAGAAPAAYSPPRNRKAPGRPSPLQHPLPEAIRSFRFNAPPSPSANPTPPTDPELDHLVLSPLVLAVTVDGHVHALQRETGQWVWTLHDDGGIALGGATKAEQRQRLKAGEAVGGPLVKAATRRKMANAGGAAAANGTGLILTDDYELEDEMYVIEPFSGGDIYLHTRNSDGEGELEKLPLSMQELVARSPFSFPSPSSRMFIGKKDTKFVGVDLRTGRLVGVFGADAGWCEWDEQREGRVLREEEYDEEISRRPEDLLYMARTEYHLSIFAKNSAVPLQTLTYTTYTTSSLGSTLQSEWTRTPDSRYLQPMHDGSLLCFVAGVPGVHWSIDFEVPVVSVFDVALTTAMDGNGESAQPLLFEHPHPLLVDEELPLDFEQLSLLPATTYLGRIGNDLFAMSRDHFPLVTFSPPNELLVDGIDAGEGAGMDEDSGTPEDGEDGSPQPAAACRGIDCLLGRHVLRPGVSSGVVDATIDGPSPPLLIEGPSQPPRSAPTSATPNRSSPHFPNRSTVLASLSKPVRKISNGDANPTLFVTLLAVLGYLYARKLWTGKSKLEDGVAAPVEPTKAKRSPSPVVDQKIDVLPPTPGDDLPLPPLDPSSPTPSTPPTPALPLSPSGSPIRARSSSLSQTLSQSPIISALKELPPLPPQDDNVVNGDAEGEGDSDGGEGKAGEGAPRKKGRRRRGKKTKKNAVAVVEPVGLAMYGEGEGVGDKELEGLRLSEADIKEEGSEEGPAVDVVRLGEPQTIGGLSVSETILGYGSHGTVVLRGEFQGRAVAVKRLLKDFVTIATHEVALLQESDDHPHVIRYFCKEQRDTFLYIALELCPASLFDLIDQPSSFPELVRDLDSKRALKQIASGIRHLHKLKIVHRDIKPQNILVSTSRQGGKGVRMLISDFGLCKKLDLDESSFQQTVNHAAGSFGYRAPEVLRGQVDPNDAGTPSHSTNGVHSLTSTSTGSAGATTTDPSMRLTRSIDIFSLGCIFYYVLTGGEHPFGGRYEREMNILQGKISLERLDGLGEEAVEVQDLITRMVASDPRERPSAEAVLLHPFFWNAQKRLLFICDASDRFEIMERDPPTPTLVTLEERGLEIVGDDWQKAIDRTLLDNLGKYRKYDGRSVRDLLRVLRNKKHHYQDLPEAVRKNLGDLPGGFLSYFTTRFPHLLLHVFSTVEQHLSDEAMFASTFRIPDEEQ